MNLNDAIHSMTGEIAAVLSGSKPSIYLYGSIALDDFQLGWSDIDILVLTEREMTDPQAETLVRLRQDLLARHPGNAYFQLFEGGMISADAFIHGKHERAVYWGTSGQRITDGYQLDSFGMAELLEQGILLHGDDIRHKLTVPPYRQMLADIARHIQSARKFGTSAGWLLDIARGIYTVRTGKIISKTAAGEWVLEAGLCPDTDLLQKALQIRKEPLQHAKEERTVSNAVIQRFADVLENEMNSLPAPGFFAYEKRYQTVYASGVPLWGHAADDEVLVQALTGWVAQNGLQGRRVIEYACGEGSAGVILSRLGCAYHGVDIAPSALRRAKQALTDYPDAAVVLLDMVNERVSSVFDAAIDIMGLHMLVTDNDRKKYLENVCASLKPGAPALFFRESYSESAYSGTISSVQEWKAITGDDYETPEERQVTNNGITYSVHIPRIPARAKKRADYIAEMTEAGFIVDQFIDMDPSKAIWYAASIYVHKGGSP